MKSLKPSHREKKRYLLISGKNAGRKEIEEILLEYVGVLGYAKISPQFVGGAEKKEGKAGKLILAINRKELDKVRASFAISEKDVKIEKVSGSLIKLKKN